MPVILVLSGSSAIGPPPSEPVCADYRPHHSRAASHADPCESSSWTIRSYHQGQNPLVCAVEPPSIPSGRMSRRLSHAVGATGIIHALQAKSGSPRSHHRDQFELYQLLRVRSPSHG